MTLKEVLSNIGEKIVVDAKANLKKNKKVNTGKLYNSIHYKIEKDKLSFEMENYAKFVDGGRKPGTYAPVDSIKKWCKQKGINSKYAFVINRAIMKRGIQPTFFFTDAYAANTEDLDAIIDKYVEAQLDELDQYLTD